MSQGSSLIIRQLLANWHAGDDEALRDIIPIVYPSSNAWRTPI